MTSIDTRATRYASLLAGNAIVAIFMSQWMVAENGALMVLRNALAPQMTMAVLGIVNAYSALIYINSRRYVSRVFEICSALCFFANVGVWLYFLWR